jgi:isopropylmalate/homocitrate/citramalate synthase
MTRLEVFDTTLRDGEQAPGNSLCADYKIEIARFLESLGVDIIECGFPASSREDYEAAQKIAGSIKAKVCALARCRKDDIDTAKKALENASHPVLHLFYPASDLHLEKKLGVSREKALDVIAEHVTYAKRFFDEIVFSAEDATRSDIDHLVHAFDSAYSAGAMTLDIADTTGYAQPSEMARLVEIVKEHFPESRVGVHCHDDLGLAVANTLASVKAGADHIQVTMNGIGERAGNAALEEVVISLLTRQDYYPCISTGIIPQKIMATSRLVYERISREPSFEKAIVGVNAFRHEAGIHISAIKKDYRTYEHIDAHSLRRRTEFVYGRHSGRHSSNWEKMRSSIDEAYAIIKEGGLAIIPSRVGYTLLGNSESSIRKMFKIKNRPLSKPCVVLTNNDIVDKLAYIGTDTREMIDNVDCEGLLCGFVLHRKPSDMYESLSDWTNMYSQNDGTSCFVINAGKYIDYLVEKASKDGVLIVGSSANMSGTGNEGIFLNIPGSIRTSVECAIEDDAYVSEGYDPKTREQGVILDCSSDKAQVTRKGFCYNQIKYIVDDVMKTRKGEDT